MTTPRSGAVIPLAALAAVTAAVVAFVVGFGTAPSAAAITLTEHGTRARWANFSADGCVPAERSLRLPADAFDIEVLGPLPGTTLVDDIDFEAGRVASAQVDETGAWPKVVWTVGPVGDDCELLGYWETRDYRLRAAYSRRVLFALTRNNARGLASAALGRRFSFWEYANVSKLRCRRTPTRFRCAVGFWGGDVSFDGVVRGRVWANAARDGLRWRWRLNVRMTNSYCLDQRPGPSCYRRYRGGQRNVAAPSWLWS